MKAVPSGPRQERKQGIWIRYGKLTGDDLQSAVEKLSQFVDWSDSKDLWRYAKFYQAFRREEKKAGMWYRKIIDKHAEKEAVQKMSKITNKMEDAYDEKTGKPITRPKRVPGPQGQITFAMKDEDAFKQDIKIFDNHKTDIKVLRFSAEDLVKAKLTPTELAACLPMIDNPPEDLVELDDDEEMLREELFDETESDSLLPEDDGGSPKEPTPGEPADQPAQ